MDGILVVNKPTGMTSFRCLSIVKRRLRLGKVGFLGTLDPSASGVLVLLCGGYTKMADKLHEGEKTYVSRFLFGVETPSLDLDTEITARSEVIPTRADILAVLPKMVGDIEITVPKYSAVHIDGRRAYELARAGVEFDAPKKVVNVSRFELLDCGGLREGEFQFEITCQSGTYIRSLAQVIAGKLGTIAVASEIIRTKVGDFDISGAKSIDNVTIDDIIQL